ncbi:N-acetylmuramoyl-L-alanine amidase [Streptomyces wuyuanensis]|uniref:N-acetylmuramoyl-L-alanine amidase n=1 Tax=Streptomyces wuyuanensis TaxID=1196353 RepID=UPI003434081E
MGVALAAEEGERKRPASTQRIALPSDTGVVGQRSTEPFSLLGLSWDDPAASPSGTVEARARDARTGSWSPWLRLQSHGHGPVGDARSARGASEPVWVGSSDGVELRVTREGEARTELPRGARLDLIDPGADGGAEAREGAREAADGQPSIVSRAGWGADERLLPPGAEPGDPSTLPEYNTDVKAVFVHHTAGTNDYGCAESPAIIRAIHEFHVRVNGWKDIGYNFLVDKCGTVFEGRKGGIDKPVLGAHTLGFNRESSGVAVLGHHVAVPASQETSAAVAAVAAWKLGQYGADPAGTATLLASATQTNYFRKPFKAGDSYEFSRISSHRDGVDTECAGDRLYDQLPLIRQLASDPTDHSQPTHDAGRTPPG